MSYFNQSVFKSPKILVTTHTSAQNTSSTGVASGGSFVTILGSQIEYTPEQNSTKVVYEISYCAYRNGQTFSEIQLQESLNSGSSWSEINAKFKKNLGHGSYFTAQYHRWYLHHRFILPAWSGSRQLRLTIGMESNSRPLTLHKLGEWDGASATNQFSDTNLLVYSI